MACLVFVACGTANETPALSEVLEPNPEAMSEALTNVQEYTQECMAELGFEYVAYVRSGENPGPRSLRAVVSAGSDPDFVAESGYGITQLHVFTEDRIADDPNRAIREELTGADRVAYTQAFADCIVAGQEDVGLNQLGTVSSELYTAIEALDAQILADERVLQATSEWAQCMRDRGYDYTSLSQPVDEIQDAAQLLFDERAAGLHSHGAQSHSHDEGESEHTHEVDPDLTGEVQEMQDREITVASDDVECRDETGLLDILDEVRAEHDARFLSENAELIDSYQGFSS